MSNKTILEPKLPVAQIAEAVKSLIMAIPHDSKPVNSILPLKAGFRPEVAIQ